MLSKLWSRKGKFETYDVTVSLISCTNLKISGGEANVNNGVDDVKLYASFIANNEGIPLTIDGIAGNKQIISKPLMRTHAVDTTAMFGDNKRSCTTAQFSHKVPKKKKAQSTDVAILLGLLKGEESCPLAETILHIDPSSEDSIFTLRVNDIPAEWHSKKRRFKLFSFMKRKAKEEPQQPDQPDQPVLLNIFDLQSSAQGAKLNLRVQVRGKGESNASAMVEEARHDVDTEGETFEDKREDIVEQEEDDQDSVEEIVADEFVMRTYVEQAANEPLSIMENVLRRFSCGNILTCQGEEEEFKSDNKPTEESRGESPTDVVDKTVERDLKKMVENVRNELEIGHTASESYEDESEDASYTVGPTTVGADTYTVGADTYTVGTHTVADKYAGLGTVEEDTFAEGTVQSRKVHFRTSTCTDEEDTTVDDENTKQKRCHDDCSYDDTFTAFDNTAFTDDVTAFTRADDSTFMGGHVFM
eukprot:scaffold2132_cov152-Skeletonema_menzelii.AAC.8